MRRRPLGAEDLPAIVGQPPDSASLSGAAGGPPRPTNSVWAATVGLDYEQFMRLMQAAEGRIAGGVAAGGGGPQQPQAAAAQARRVKRVFGRDAVAKLRARARLDARNAAVLGSGAPLSPSLLLAGFARLFCAPVTCFGLYDDWRLARHDRRQNGLHARALLVEARGRVSKEGTLPCKDRSPRSSLDQSSRLSSVRCSSRRSRVCLKEGSWSCCVV